MIAHLPAAEVEAVEVDALDDLVVVDNLVDVEDDRAAADAETASAETDDPDAVLLPELELDDEDPTQLVSLPA